MSNSTDNPGNPQQSPINITGYKTCGTPQLSFEYAGNADRLSNTEEAGFKVLYEDAGGIRIGDDTYQLIEAHTHNPSEHTIEGQRFALELHLVHKRGDQIAVIGILYRLGNPNPAIQTMLDDAPDQSVPDIPITAIPASNFLPSNHSYYGYTGSLTTPPYTEGVRWHVLSEALEVSPDQVERLAALRGGGENSRELQSLNGREIAYYGICQE